MTKPGFFIKARRALEVMGQADEASFKEFYSKARSAIREGNCDYGYGEAEEMISKECSACYEACVDYGDECCF